MTLSKNQLFAMEDSGDVLRVYSALPVNLASVAQATKQTEVYADEIIIDGVVSTNGQDIKLVCRRLTFGFSAAIDTTGVGGTPNYSPGLRPAGASSPGADGPDGAAGGQGARGGNVRICACEVVGEVTVVARGGKGGRAQDGGHGQIGPQGPDGPNVTVKEPPPAAAGIGGIGGAGGRAGLPGPRARGGSGGKVVIETIVELAQRAAISVDRGESGEPGSGGSAGGGGQGGAGGTVVVIAKTCEPGIHGGMMPMRGRARENLLVWNATNRRLSETSASIQDAGQFDVHARLELVAVHVERYSLFLLCGWDEIRRYQADSGGTGPKGDDRTAEIQARQAQPDAEKWIDGESVTAQVDFATLGSLFDTRALDLMVLNVENEFRQSGNQLASGTVAKLDFLLRLTSALADTSRVCRELLARVYSMTRKSSLRLDYYGYTVERVPLLSYESYTNSILPDVLSRGCEIESSFNKYWDMASSSESRRTQLRTSLDASNVLLQGLILEFSSRTAEAKSQLAALPALEARVDAAKALLARKKDELNAAIAAKHPGCDLVSCHG